MKKNLLLITFLLVTLTSGPAWGFWVWTPESKKWVNPKKVVQDTPLKQLEMGIEMYQAKEYKLATKALLKLIKHFPRAKEAAEAQYYISRIAEDQGNLLDAFRKYQVVVEKYPFSERFGEIVKRQYDIGIQLLETVANPKGFMQKMTGGNTKVVEIFETVIKNSPYGEFAAQAQYKIALYYKERKLLQEARDEFEKTINDYPDSEWAKAAKYQIALADAERSKDAPYDQKVTADAIEGLREVAEENPESELSQGAKSQIQELREKEAEKKFLIAEFYVKQKKYKAAKIYYNKIIDDYKNTSWASQALTRLRETTELEK